MIGTTIRDRYRLDAVVGAGAFATVYRAHDERLEADVALKVLAENHSLDLDIRERFINEARRLRQVGSPHVVAVHDLGETDRAQPFIVMDLADRGDLARRVAAHRQAGRHVVPDDLRAVAETLAGALTAMHARRVVHRDLTPRNLLLRSTGTNAATAVHHGAGLVRVDERLLVGDLGLSKDLARASGITAAVGTAGFFPPEQRLGCGIDERTDVYAASALLVWLITGRAPADDGTWPSAALADWPPGIGDALSRGLSTDPARRQSTAAEWRGSLEEALAPADVGATLPVDGDRIGAAEDIRREEAPSVLPRRGALTPDRSRRRVRRWTAALALVLALLVATGAGWALGRTDDSVSPSEVEDVGSGNVRAEASEGGLTASIEGPDELTVGQEATFTVDPGSAASWVWIGPDGRVSPDAPSLDVVAESEGRLSVTLVAIDESGRTVRVMLPARARDR